MSNVNKKPYWIYDGDLCFFKQEQEVYPAREDWTYSKSLVRILPTDEPLVYIRRTREGRGGSWVHLIEGLGLKYVFHGSIHSFTKTKTIPLGNDE